MGEGRVGRISSTALHCDGAAGDRLLMVQPRWGVEGETGSDHFDKDYHDLVHKGKSQGYLTYDEVTRVLRTTKSTDKKVF